MRQPAVWLAQTFTPQIAKPVVNVALDRDAFGGFLTNARFSQENKAKSLQGRRETPTEYKLMAQALAKAGVDMYPEQLRQLAQGYGAGVFNEILKYVIENPNKESRGLTVVSPAFDRYILASNDVQLKSRLYYRLRDKTNEEAVKKSLGEEYDDKLYRLGEQLKRREAKVRGVYSQATKAKSATVADAIRRRGDRMRDNYMEWAFSQAQ